MIIRLKIQKPSLKMLKVFSDKYRHKIKALIDTNHKLFFRRSVMHTCPVKGCIERAIKFRFNFVGS